MRKLDLERETVIEALRAAGGDGGRAAKILGSSRRTLQSRMREFGLERGRSGRKRRFLPYGSGGERSRRGWIAGGIAAVGLAAGVVLGSRKHRGA